MPDLNAGSIANNIYNSISPLPSSVSGALITIVNNKRYLAEQLTGNVIGNAIAEQYQSPITDLSYADTLRLMAAQDLGVQNVSVGDLSTDNKNLFEMAKQFEDKGMTQLKWLTKGIKFNKTYG